MLDLWQEIYGTMKRNKLRTALTGFAVAWGIFMLIVLLGAGNGLIHAFEQSSSERALNVIRVYPGWTQLPYDGLKEGRFVELDNRDLTETERLFPDEVIETGGQVNQGGITISYGAEYISNTLIGVSPAHIKIEAVKLISGRFVNEIDINERRKVIVLHKNSAETLFKQLHTDPVGQFINVGAFSFQVVGIYGLMLAVPRRYGRADYLPVIAWGQLAVRTSQLQVGDSLSLEGRVQSRTYHKVTEDGSTQERVAYEVSMMHLLSPEP